MKSTRIKETRNLKKKRKKGWKQNASRWKQEKNDRVNEGKKAFEISLILKCQRERERNEETITQHLVLTCN